MTFKKGPAPQENPAPDYRTLWKQYSGELANINKRNEGELAAVRARLSAAGATPEMMKMQTEHLESQRKQSLQEVQSGLAYTLLKEGHDIAAGRVNNPYWTYADHRAGIMGGGLDIRIIEGAVEQNEASSKSLEEFYEGRFGKGAATPDTPAKAAEKRAAKAGGASAEGSTIAKLMSGAPAGVQNPWLDDATEKLDSTVAWLQGG